MSKSVLKKKSIAKRILKAFMITTGCFLLLVTIAVVLLFTQQQRITNLAVDELNKQFKGSFSIKKSSIDLFKNWPNVSIALHELRFFSDKTQTGTPIYQAEKLYVGFSLPDILQQRYAASS
jgi:phosphoglycerate-specific signal transduction histidine kinase